MSSVINGPAHAETLRTLKTELIELKEQIGDTDEKYPELMAVRKQAW